LFEIGRTEVIALINRAPGQTMHPAVRELVRYILSREGQHEVVRDGAFLPLRPEVVQAQRRELD
jgi:phosphate transport system substrate-binding protein